MRKVGFIILLAAGIASANPQSDQLFDEGRKLLDSGDAKGACDKFDKAIGIDPQAAGTMLNLGICNEKLNKYATALYWFRKAGNFANDTGAKPYEDKAKEHIAVLLPKVATVSITFAGGEPPADTKVKIDRDKDLGHEDYARYEIDPGSHVIDASAPGMKNYHQPFDVPDKPGPGPTLTVTFVAGSNTIVVDRGKTRRKIAIGTAIGGAVLMGVSVIYGYHERSEYCKYVNSDYTACNGNSTTPTLKSQYTNADIVNKGPLQNAEIWGTGIFVAGAAAVAGAVVLYFTAPNPEKHEQTVFVPTLTRDSAGMALTGRF